ncbi:TetR/AcrR family transcriptional regulator [Erwinia sp. S43]|uniref:TetR/AcrR family transcriptional regulator n=1 Tax=Erwinia sp. S43 TaxID=2769339 RepID=UPI00190DA766|nr:TetR/AcrR family transcriptional regulator [Erwinia sp. S43]MBK0031011.1 TetR/AcrR family transcriptional regulator [Erwinia sp. S43]
MTSNGKAAGSETLSIFDLIEGHTPSLSKRDAILAAATRLFIQNGFEKTSMDLVSQEAGVARRTLYNQYPEGKEALFRAMVERMWSSFPVIDIASQEEAMKDTATGLHMIAEAVAAFWQSNLSVAFLRMVISEGRHFPDLTESFFAYGKIPAMRGVKTYLEQQARAGKLSIQNSERASRQFLGLIDEPLLWIRVLGREENHTPLEKQAVIDEAVDMFLRYYHIEK